MSKITTSVTICKSFSVIEVHQSAPLTIEEVKTIKSTHADKSKGIIIACSTDEILIAWLVSIYRNAPWIAVWSELDGKYLVVKGTKGEVKAGNTFEIIENDSGDKFLHWHIEEK